MSRYALLLIALAFSASVAHAAPATKTHDINVALGSLWRDAERGKSLDVTKLVDALKDLDDQDTPIRRLGPGLGDPRIRENALRNRALAWLHAWAIFSHLAATPAPGSEAHRQLFDLKSRSALALLLRLHRQMRDAENDVDEPLRLRLTDGAQFIFLLEYRLEWRAKERPDSIKHRYYIPSVADLVGSPTDPPRRNDRQLLSLWALVNLHLDKWRDSPAKNTQAADDPLQLSPLADWLTALSENKDLQSLNAKGETSKFAGLLSSCADKMARFLRFRERYRDEAALDGLLTALAKQRLPLTAESDHPLRELIEAARPIALDKKEGKHTSLVDAAVWLRYVLLMSYRYEKLSLLEGQNSLPTIWAKLNLDLPLEYARPIGASMHGGFLRWDCAPQDGHATAVLADLMFSALQYLRFDANVRKLERTRFDSITNARAREEYITELGKLLKPMRDIYHRHLGGYFGTRMPGLARSATMGERGRLLDDVDALSRQVRLGLQMRELIRDAYLLDDPAAIAASLRTLGGLAGLTDGNIYALPRKSFKSYHDDLEKQLKILEQGASAVDAETAMRRTFADSRTRLELARLDLDAALLGRKITDKAVQVSRTFEEIAKIDAQISDLELRISRLRRQEAGSAQEAAGLRLAYAARMRDLAAARVEALTRASEEAEEIVQLAAKELETLEGEFRKAAKEIEKAKKKAGLLSIIKAVVSVVGAVLAPFTGGASLTVAMVVNKGIDIYSQIDQTNWSNFGEAVATVGNVAGEIGSAVDLVGKQFGGPEFKKALADTQNFLNQARDKIEKFRTLGEQGKVVIDGLKNLKSPEDILRTATALANGLPATLKDGKLVIAFGSKRIQFADKELQARLKAVFDAGGHLLNDAQARGDKFLALLGLSDDELKAKLGESLTGAIHALPADIREKLKVKVANVEQALHGEREKLKTTIENLGAKERRALAQCLAGGLLFVKDGEVVVALERPLNEESARLRQRLDAYANKIRGDAVREVIGKFEQIKRDLLAQGKELSQAKDDAGLNKLADATRPTIESLGGELKKLAIQLTIAKGELEDKEQLTKAADYDAKAAALRVEASELGISRAEQTKQRAKLALELAQAQGEIAILGDEQAAVRVQAAQLALAAAHLGLERAYLDCISRGFNPLSDDAPKLVPLNLHLRRLFANYRSEDLARRIAIESMAESLVGMIRWATLLNQPMETHGKKEAPRTPLDAYLRVLDVLHTDIPLFVKDGQADRHAAGRLKLLAQQLDDAFTKDAERLDIDLAQGEIPHDKVVWMKQDSEDYRAALLGAQATKRKQEVLGYFRFQFLAKQPGMATRWPYDIAIDGEEHIHLVDVADGIHVVAAKSQGLSFLILPPDRSVAQPSRLAMASLEDREQLLSKTPKRVLRSLEEENIKGSFRAKVRVWKEKLQLTEALGEWTVVILATGAKTEDARKHAIEQIQREKTKFEMKLVYLKIPAKP